MFAPIAQVPYSQITAPTGTGVLRDGQGWIAYGQSVAQNTGLTISYPFGRTPLWVQLLDNGTTAQTRLQVTARSATAITIKPLDAALVSALIEIR